MQLQLGPETLVTLTEEELPCTPRLALDIPAVCVCPAIDRHAHERLLSETFGSMDWLWSGDDEFRFRKCDKKLSSLSLRVPEVEFATDREPYEWLTATPATGGLRALSAENFGIPPASTRWISEQADLLVCSLLPTPSQGPDIRRLKIAKHLDLVFERGMYAGWILEEPADHLTHGAEGPSEQPTSTPLRLLFRDFMRFFVQPTYDLMAEEDPDALKELETLRLRATGLPADPRQKALLSQIEDQQEKWYGH
ncbi:hypothetical protein [Streptomyces sudanensis]|uniref:hypothetical protein n=1 Tax=Streptomyces sudanensis TaxID=436397 RepID=UPI0020CF9F12|nr:hypothetical protein [Streptomyces sudanensis]MCP9958345.1 hypothetical protein [Streptomyces sudanensis]MCQ0001138.1 hypothetical protein [Streptomyces sudanensis]